MKISRRKTKNLEKALVGRTIIRIQDDYKQRMLMLIFDNGTALVIETGMFGLAEMKTDDGGQPMKQ